MNMTSCNADTKLPRRKSYKNKAVYTATEVACGWAGALIKKAIQAFGQKR